MIPEYEEIEKYYLKHSKYSSIDSEMSKSIEDCKESDLEENQSPT